MYTVAMAVNDTAALHIFEVDPFCSAQRVQARSRKSLMQKHVSVVLEKTLSALAQS
jgi:hypothetical protein